ncbi:MAG: cytochrome P450 [Gammaproteobacteria bacterium]|nr:cytochrome P450 [Gammaproteobacteria bacterium]MCP5200964.1 cytochrome P450 [Gammaproteobacteria bacterium]
MSRLTAASAADFVLATSDHAFAVDPYPDFATLRAHAPLCRQPDGSYLLTRYADLLQVFGDPVLFSSDKRVDFKPRFGDSPLYEHHTTSIVFNDPPYHTRVRRLLAPFFAHRVLRQMEDSIARMVDALLDRAAERGTIDIAQEFATVVPLNLIGELLGVPYDERNPLRAWANAILGALEPVRSAAELATGNRAVEDFKAYLRTLIARKRANPPGADAMDVLWALIEASEGDADDADTLTELEILHNSIFMLNAGHDTTGSLIANGVDLLLRYPEQRARLQDEPALIKSAVEEMLRFESPLQIGNRRTTAATSLGGVDLAPGTFLHLGIAAANRDPARFDQPETFDIARNPNKHLAFAHGIHTCAGNSVARIEARIAFGKLLERFPRFERAGPTVRPHRSRFRVVESLPVRLEPAS